MEISKIEHDLIAFLKENILAENVVLTTVSEFKNLGVDSYSIVEIVLFIERKYQLIILDNQLTPQNFENVTSIAELVYSELKKI